MKIFLILIIFVNFLFSYNEDYSFRKYNHIKEFYKPIIKETIKIALKYDMPPAAILAMASVESGYGRGYVAKITGNILSLGAGKSEKELPSLYLPNLKKPYKVLYNEKEIKKYKKSQLVWKQRPKSLKKDYRPNNLAGTTKNLDYFDYHKQERIKANLKNIEEFCSKWINLKSNYKVFRDARKLLNERVKMYGKGVLFTKELNTEFINSIGGKPNSYNYREAWPKKIVKVMEKTGLIRLSEDIYLKRDFEKVW
ncbi:glucosaminidase domain-containing protein [Halarcobacter ebronensis]|uniref:Mannosyl-glycoprotein endo-beta-N-acetylglucosamidase-like domain-containing protein n=1 Tax=Halarcobacter ebronensis TaxID=1462615 RepID=A0A4Q1AJN9_9BACT|nr:glucosaminidase domain-containing protein [Halarcobacter ebronensis]QKF81922.1 hypothetical protein AEBR_1435 [Halarcobacter ebronensis]RXK04359.1 hypothetical protein CRV07_11360 [Halarcobacter ebronensis]